MSPDYYTDVSCHLPLCEGVWVSYALLYTLRSAPIGSGFKTGAKDQTYQPEQKSDGFSTTSNLGYTIQRDRKEYSDVNFIG